MKKVLFSSRTQSPRVESPGMVRRLSKSPSLVPVLVFLMLVSSVTGAGLKCSQDSDCRRNVCIFEACGPRPTTGGTCQLDTHCFNAASESCVSNVCLTKSAPGGVCDTSSDCSTTGSTCSSNKCLLSSGASCSLNPECVSPLACISSKCSTKSAPGGDCDEDTDCATTGSVCSSSKCLLSSGAPCSLNPECVSPLACISSKCSTKSATGGDCDEVDDCTTSGSTCSSNKCLLSSGSTCSLNPECVSPLACISSKCLTKSATGGDCDEDADCSTTGSTCSSNKCLLSSGASCSLNPECVSPLACISSKCSTKSATGGACDEDADCATTGSVCSSSKCTTPFNPSLMVWEGNKAPINSAPGTPSVVVNGILFVFEGYSSTSTLMTVEAYDPVANTWSSKMGPGISLSYHSVVAVGSSVFLIGGTSGGNPSTTFFVYDTIAGTWDKTWTQLPEGRYNHAAAAVDSTVFIFGGIAASNTKFNSIRSLDVSTKGKAWNILSATLSAPTSDLSAATVGTDIFLTGGRIASGVVNTVLKYNSLTPNVSPSPINSMLLPRQNHMSFYDPTSKRLYAIGFVIGIDAVEYLDLSVSSSGSWVSANAPNYVYIASSYSGGLIGSLFYFASGRSFQVLDVSVPSSVKWSPFSNSPSPLATLFQMTSPTTIITLDTNFARKTSFYDTVSNTWTAGGTPSKYPLQATNAASALVNGEVFVIGGENSVPSTIASVYSLNTAGTLWTKKDDIPAKKSGGCAAADGTDIYYYGGALVVSVTPVNTLFKMDTTKPALSQWSEVPLAGVTPTAVMNCAAVVVGRKLLIFGGGTKTQGSSPTGLIQSFDIPSQTWETSPGSLLTARSYLSAVYLKGFVFVIGGSPVGGSAPTPLNKVEVFDVTAKTVKAIKDLPTSRFGLGSVTDGSSIFSVGGSNFPSLEKLHTP